VLTTVIDAGVHEDKEINEMVVVKVVTRFAARQAVDTSRVSFQALVIPPSWKSLYA
jgi:hypothetical protein